MLLFICDVFVLVCLQNGFCCVLQFNFLFFFLLDIFGYIKDLDFKDKIYCVVFVIDGSIMGVMLDLI